MILPDAPALWPAIYTERWWRVWHTDPERYDGHTYLEMAGADPALKPPRPVCSMPLLWLDVTPAT
jgi:hypothetical protein